MRKILLKIASLILLLNSNFVVSQEYRNLKTYKKETSNSILLDGYWLKKDRKKKTLVWKNANQYNLQQLNAHRKYRSIREIRDFYLWFDNYRKQRGHEVQWIGIAAMASSQLAKLEVGFYKIFIIRNKELVQFAQEGSKKVFSETFPKLKKIYCSTNLILGSQAENWDEKHGKIEQCDLLNPLYAKLSPKAFNKLERMAKGKGIYKLAIPTNLKFEGDLKNCRARIIYGKEKLLPIYLKKQISGR